MSASHLQRVVVRMLYDSAFVAGIFADPAAALHDVDLTAAERSWLVQADPRAYAVDPFRRARTLTALIEEFPVSVHTLGHHVAQPTLVEAFFSAPPFHACMQQRGSLAAAFGTYLGSADMQRFTPGNIHPDLVHLEAAIARLRRRRYRAADTVAAVQEDGLALASTVALLDAPAGMLTYYQTVLAALQRHPEGLVAAACQPAANPLPPRPTTREWLLIVWHPASASATLEILPDALGAVLAAVPASRATLLTQLGTLGAARDEAEEILHDLLADGVLCAQDPVAGSTHD